MMGSTRMLRRVGVLVERVVDLHGASKRRLLDPMMVTRPRKLIGLLKDHTEYEILRVICRLAHSGSLEPPTLRGAETSRMWQIPERTERTSLSYAVIEETMRVHHLDTVLWREATEEAILADTLVHAGVKIV